MLGKKPDYPAPIVVMEAFLCSLLASGCISELQRTELKAQLERWSGFWERQHAESPRGAPVSRESMVVASSALASLARIAAEAEMVVADDLETKRQKELARIEAKLDVLLAAVSIPLSAARAKPDALADLLYQRTLSPSEESQRREAHIGVEGEYQECLSQTIKRVSGEEG